MHAYRSASRAMSPSSVLLSSYRSVVPSTRVLTRTNNAVSLTTRGWNRSSFYSTTSAVANAARPLRASSFISPSSSSSSSFRTSIISSRSLHTTTTLSKAAATQPPIVTAEDVEALNFYETLVLVESVLSFGPKSKARRVVLDALISKASNANEIENALRILREYSTRLITLNEATCDLYVDVCLRAGEPKMAANFLSEHHLLRVWPTAHSCTTTAEKLYAANEPDLALRTLEVQSDVATRYPEHAPTAEVFESHMKECLARGMYGDALYVYHTLLPAVNEATQGDDKEKYISPSQAVVLDAAKTALHARRPTEAWRLIDSVAEKKGSGKGWEVDQLRVTALLMASNTRGAIHAYERGLSAAVEGVSSSQDTVRELGEAFLKHTAEDVEKRSAVTYLDMGGKELEAVEEGKKLKSRSAPLVASFFRKLHEQRIGLPDQKDVFLVDDRLHDVASSFFPASAEEESAGEGEAEADGAVGEGESEGGEEGEKKE